MAECMLHVGFSSGTNMCKGRRWCVNILQVVLQYHLHLFSISLGFEKLEEWCKWRPKSIICYLVLPILRRLSGFIVAVCFFILFLNFLFYLFFCLFVFFILQVLIRHQFYTHQCIHVNPNSPIQHNTIPTPPQYSPLGVHMSVLYICVSTSALHISSSVPFF